MYKKILVGIDGSETSIHALEEALDFSKKYKAEVLAISVIPQHRELVSSFSVFGHIKDLLRKPYEKALNEAKDLAEDMGVSIKTFLEEGDPYKKIIEVAQKEGCDLIITGRRGITSFEKILIGSTAHKVINNSPVDVLIVPKNTQINFKKLLAGTDTSEYGNKAVKKAGEIAKKFNGELGVISVIKIPVEPIIDLQEILETLRKDMESYLVSLTEEIAKDEVKVEIFVDFGEPYKVVIDTAKKINATTIVISAYSSASEKSLGSVGEKVIANSFCPVLVVKN
ncbi:MAG: universal stress protein [Thermodesulfobacterium sp.]|nr:universal stress protein [Thermodesulfobacterium sp.]